MMTPNDEHNQTLLSHVHPVDWQNPQPAARYDLVVIGAGTAGLVTAAGAAGLGAKVALVEKHLMGGDCLNVGCVPSKALIAAARAAASARSSSALGVHLPGEIQVDFAAVMTRMRRLRSSISPHDSAQRFTELGVDVFLGQGAFTDDGNAVQVDDLRLPFRKAVICTGARAAVPPIPGLAEAGHLTNETIFNLTELPPRLGIIGGGPIGCEMAQSFAAFGSRVSLFDTSSRLLSRDDEDASNVVMRAFQNDGVDLNLNATVERVEQTSRGKVITAKIAGETVSREVDAILVAAGRAPNVEGLNLDAVGVGYDRSGVQVNDFLRTANRRIFAAGDICFPAKFTHAADFLARIVIQNSLFFGRSRASKLIIPWSTYTTPEVAHVGLLPQQAHARGVAIQTFTQEFQNVDRAILDGIDTGFVKVHVKSGTDRILGATVVAPNAGDLISEITLAMKNRIGLKGIGSTIHPYPTHAEAIRKLGDQYNRTRLTPLTRKILGLIMKLS